MPLTLVGFVGLVFDLLNLASGAAPLGCAPRAPDSEAHQRPRAGRHGAFYGLLSLRPSISGSLAKFATMRRACLKSQHFRQRRDVGGDAPSLVVGQQVRRPASARPTEKTSLVNVFPPAN